MTHQVLLQGIKKIMAMTRIPVFCRASTLEVLQYALDSEDGILKDLETIAYCYLSETGEFAYVDQYKNVFPIVGHNRVLVQQVEALPSATEAETDVLYIYNNIVYIWTGTEFRPTFYEVAIQLDNLTEQLNKLENRVQIDEDAIQEIVSRLGTVESTVSSISSSISQLSRDINALDQIKADADDVYTKSEVDEKLSVDGVPIVNYVETQISEVETGYKEYTDSAKADAIDYTNQQLELHFI